MLLAVLETPIRSQIHGETNLHQTILLKRYLVSTTGEFQIPVIEPTRVFLPPGPKLRRQPVPVEKVGLRAHALITTSVGARKYGTRSVTVPTRIGAYCHGVYAYVPRA